MEKENHLGKANRVDGPESVAVKIFNDFENASIPKPFEGFGVLMLRPELSQIETVSDFSDRRRWKCQKVISGTGNPAKFLHAKPGPSKYVQLDILPDLPDRNL